MNSRSPLVIAIGSLLWAVASAACDGVADFDITEDENGLGAACDERIRGTERLFKGRSRSAPAQLALLFLLTAR